MMQTARTIMWLTWRQLFAKRRIWLAVAIAVLPFLLTFFYRLASEDREGDRLSFMLGLHREMIIAVLLPLTAVVFGTIAFGGDVEDGTLIYLLVKPLPRWLVVLGKYVVSVIATVLVIWVAMLLAWLSLRNAELPARFLWAFLLAATAAAAIYCAVFLYMGLATRRGLVFGLLYVIVFENVVSRVLQGVRALSVREFAVSISQWAGDGVVKWPGYTVPMTTVSIAGTIILAVSIAVAVRKLSRYETAERL